MDGASRKAVGIVALTLSLLMLGTTVAIASSSFGIRLAYPAFWSRDLGTIYLLDAVLTVVLYLGLAWTAHRETAGGFFLAAAFAFAISFSGGVSPIPWLIELSLLCVAVGFFLGSPYPRWLAWTAVLTLLLRLTQRLAPNRWMVPISSATDVHGLLVASYVVAYQVLMFGIAFELLVGVGTSRAPSNKRIERTPQTLS